MYELYRQSERVLQKLLGREERVKYSGRRRSGASRVEKMFNRSSDFHLHPSKAHVNHYYNCATLPQPILEKFIKAEWGLRSCYLSMDFDVHAANEKPRLITITLPLITEDIIKPFIRDRERTRGSTKKRGNPLN
jgi:hypothetical protein